MITGGEPSSRLVVPALALAAGGLYLAHRHGFFAPAAKANAARRFGRHFHGAASNECETCRREPHSSRLRQHFP